MFKKLKYYPVKLVIIFAILSICYFAEFETAGLVIFFIAIEWMIFEHFCMKNQTRKHLDEIKNKDMEYYEYLKIGKDIKRFHFIPFLILGIIGLVGAIMIFTIFVTIIIFVAGCSVFYWSSKIVNIGIEKAYQQNILSEQQTYFYKACQHFFLLDLYALNKLDSYYGGEQYE